ncbi:MAG: phage holin family protein, partial [Candidatus Eremiobacteraeota bacterium]|nr:phage holin family protein [Candidatus Eremiobacteraeota bacterium]
MILRFIVNAIALYLIAKYVPGFNHNASFGTALIAALIFGIVNALLGPILRFVTFPLTVVTLGLFSIVVN